MRHVPNTLTIARIIITPLMLVLLLSETFYGQLWALVLFILAAISDYLDGKLARHYSVKSRLGQFLDPFADKVLVLGTFAALAFLEPEIVPWWAVALIALRDLMVTGLRMWAESHGRSLRTLNIAKLKTLVQLVFLIIVLFLVAFEKAPGILGTGAAWVLNTSVPFIILIGVVAFTVITGIVYLLHQDYISPIKLNG